MSKREESKMQIACVNWYRLQYPKLSKALFSVPNGGKRNKREAVILKQEGVTAGVTDLILSVPNKLNNGLFIEMKTDKGVVSKEQKKFIILMRSLGYGAIVCRSFEQFMEAVNNQMRNR